MTDEAEGAPAERPAGEEAVADGELSERELEAAAGGSNNEYVPIQLRMGGMIINAAGSAINWVLGR